MEKITLQMGAMGETPSVTILGDDRERAYPRWRLQLLDGWDAPVETARFSIEDPNGGNYVSKLTRKVGKLITIVFSIYHERDLKGFQALQSLNSLTTLESLLSLTVETVFEDGAKVKQSLKNCYFIDTPTVEKLFGEYKITLTLASKDSALDAPTITPAPIPDPKPEPEPEKLPGESGYKGKVDGEVGVGLQTGKVWDSSTQQWKTPAAETVSGLYLGEPSTAENPVGLGFFWDGVADSWVTTDPTTRPEYHVGTGSMEIGVESWNLNHVWEGTSTGKRWWDYPIDMTRVTLDDFYKKQLGYGNWLWVDYGIFRIRGYYDEQNNLLTATNLVQAPEYYKGTTHGQKGIETWNSNLWWTTNPRIPTWTSVEPGEELPPRTGGNGTYHGEFRARHTDGDSLYWDSSMGYWESTNPLDDPDYVAGVEDKQEYQTPYGIIYWNIEINAYQSKEEFFTSRGEYPVEEAPWYQYHGKYENGGYWNSMSSNFEYTDWISEPGYVPGVDNGEPSWEWFASGLYWNESINFYQSESEYYDTNGYWPSESPGREPLYHGKPETGYDGYYWNSMSSNFEGTDWISEYGYAPGIDSGEPSSEWFASGLYWNESINFYQSENEYYDTNRYWPSEKQSQ